MNKKGTTLKEFIQRRMIEVAEESTNDTFTAKGMVGLLVDAGVSRTPQTARVCMWMKTHPRFSTIRTGNVLQFKYRQEATA